MNPWFEAFTAALGAEGVDLDSAEAAAILELAGAAARSAGARQFAPIATYLAGRLAAGGTPEERVGLLLRAAEAAVTAGTASEPLDLG